ncbi:MAG: putative toxin-antitoxin system toxin component, PIN family [Saprospiraceae bacterium]|nr:putative toxin-antitoxin system toxin component, PIN family [Saprospiraceae bacterium]
MKIILDTNIYISAFIFEGFLAKVFDYCLKNEKTYPSEYILSEFSSKVIHKFKTPKHVCEAIIWTIRENVFIVTPNNPIPTICRDADDNNILQLAQFVEADFIVTGDKDLLILETFGSTQIVTPRLFYDTFIVK